MQSTLSRRFWRASILSGFVGLATISVYAAVDLGKAGDLWSQSVALEGKADYKGAIAKIGEFSRAGADQYLVNLRVGWLALQNKDYDQAIANYQAAAGRTPTAVTPLQGLASAYRAKGDNDNAEHACRSILSHDPGNATALQMLGLIYFDKKDYQNAALVYDSILRLYPEDTAALSGYGWAQIYLNHKANAIPEFQRLLILSPTYQYAQDGYTAATSP
jgi:tetratricopeptide (TPR) repeat protein